MSASTIVSNSFIANIDLTDQQETRLKNDDRILDINRFNFSDVSNWFSKNNFKTNFIVQTGSILHLVSFRKYGLLNSYYLENKGTFENKVE